MASEPGHAPLSTEAANHRRGSLPSTPPPAHASRRSGPDLGLSVETLASPSTPAVK